MGRPASAGGRRAVPDDGGQDTAQDQAADYGKGHMQMAGTKPHKISPAVLSKPLSVAQHNAIDLLIVGKPDREVADAVGAARETVWSWRHTHPLFIAELNRRRHALWAEAHERLRALVGQAVAVLERAVVGGDLKAAVEVLKIVKVHGAVPPPSGPEDPELVQWQQAEAWARREVQREGPEDPVLALVGDVRQRREHELIHQRMAALRQHGGMADDA